MAIHIEEKDNKFYINNVSFNINNWKYIKELDFFTNEEVKAFDNYIKSIKNGK